MASSSSSSSGSGPNIDIFVTSILSNPAIRGRHERTRRALLSARVPYREHDVAGDEEAKKLWKRKNGGKNELPFVLVDGEPVGSIEDMDDAVEFGELRQFLRLDEPRPSPLSAPTTMRAPSYTAPATVSSAPPPQTATDGRSHRIDAALSKPKPSLDDFADLNLTEAELASLAAELTASSPEETCSSLLSASQSRPSNPGASSSSSSSAAATTFGGYGFSHSQQFTPSYTPTQPLKLEKVNFVRPIDRRLADRNDERDVLDGIETDSLDEDALERLARELELEDEADARKRSGVAQIGAIAGRAGESAPPMIPVKTVESSIAPPLADVTAVEGDGGPSLSKPLKEVEALTVPDVETALGSSNQNGQASRSAEANSAPSERVQLQVEPESDFERRAHAEAAQAATSARQADASAARPDPHQLANEAASSTDSTGPSAQVRQVKKVPDQKAQSEMPTFGVQAMQPEPSVDDAERDVTEEQRAQDRRVAEAIRDGEL